MEFLRKEYVLLGKEYYFFGRNENSLVRNDIASSRKKVS
jgi:hypothetical protein